jgi:hypothetical protein
LIPFFCAATALCVAYAAFGADVARLYGADIAGAGLGSLGLLAVLSLLHPADALRVILGLGCRGGGARGMADEARRPAVAFALAALAGPWLLPAPALELVPSDYKDLRQALRVKDARIAAQRFSPLGVVTVVDSPLAPLHHAPGLSLNAAAGPPPQLGLFVDGQAAGALTRYDGDRAPLGYLADTTAALPYRLLDRPRVLVLGAGAGGDVLQALAHGARRIDAVELDAQVVALVQQDLAAFSGRPYSAPGVRLYVAEARGFVAASREDYDLIQVALLDAFGSSAAGLGALSESHLYTVEALQAYLARLAPGGLLAITRWVALPPRDSLRLFATAIAALERRGVADPGRSLAMIRSWNTVTLLVKNGEFSARRGRRHRRVLSRALVRHRGSPRHRRPPRPTSSTSWSATISSPATQALLGPERQDFVDRYKFDIAPVGDDRPYFFHFFKWRTLPELVTLRARGGLPPLDWGYPILVMALLQAVVASLLLILLPLALGRTRAVFAAARRRCAGAWRCISSPSGWASWPSRFPSCNASRSSSAIRCMPRRWCWHEFQRVLHGPGGHPDAVFLPQASSRRLGRPRRRLQGAHEGGDVLDHRPGVDVPAPGPDALGHQVRRETGHGLFVQDAGSDLARREGPQVADHGLQGVAAVVDVVDQQHVEAADIGVEGVADGHLVLLAGGDIVFDP